eukprot:jgi/Botrbrau1/23673/Bobra.55_2s0054.1
MGNQGSIETLCLIQKSGCQSLIMCWWVWSTTPKIAPQIVIEQKESRDLFYYYYS